MPLGRVPGRCLKTMCQIEGGFDHGEMQNNIQIVDGHSTSKTVTVTSYRNTDKATVLRVVVELWGPVNGKVLGDWTGRTSGLAEVVVVGSEAESVASSNVMHMRSNQTRGDQGVGTLLDKTARATHTPESVGLRGEEGDQAQSESREHVYFVLEGGGRMW